MLTRNKKMHHALSGCIFSSPVNVAVWESISQGLHVPAGVLAGHGQCLLQAQFSGVRKRGAWASEGDLASDPCE